MSSFGKLDGVESHTHTFRKSLESGEGLTSVSLLDTDVNVILGLLLLCRLGGSVLL